MTSLFNHPTFYAHVLGALLLLSAAILFFRNMRNINIYQKIQIILVASIAVTVHGISHYILEKYGFMPLAQK